MSDSKDKGYRLFPCVNRGIKGKKSNHPSDFFFKKDASGEKLFWCLRCETQLYPAKTSGSYLYQRFLCAGCLKLWKRKKLTLLATGKIAGVAGSWVDLTGLEKLGLRKRVYHNEHR